MPRPNYREQDGCWNCGKGCTQWYDAIVKCRSEVTKTKMTDLYAICDDWTKEKQ